MTKRLITLMAALLVLGFVVTGCGDDENSGDSGDTSAQTVTDTDVVTDDEVVTDTDTETVTDETDADNGGAVVPQNLQQAIQLCKDNIDKASQLSADTKASLQEICEKAGSGDEQNVREATVEVCEKVIGDSVPEGTPGREQALAACDKAGQ